MTENINSTRYAAFFQLLKHHFRV